MIFCIWLEPDLLDTILLGLLCLPPLNCLLSHCKCVSCCIIMAKQSNTSITNVNAGSLVKSLKIIKQMGSCYTRSCSMACCTCHTSRTCVIFFIYQQTNSANFGPAEAFHQCQACTHRHPSTLLARCAQGTRCQRKGAGLLALALNPCTDRNCHPNLIEWYA